MDGDETQESDRQGQWMEKRQVKKTQERDRQRQWMEKRRKAKKTQESDRQRQAGAVDVEEEMRQAKKPQERDRKRQWMEMRQAKKTQESDRQGPQPPQLCLLPFLFIGTASTQLNSSSSQK